jgi:hypothetical protein
MTSTINSITPLRQRMIDDMRMRKLYPKTQAGYINQMERKSATLLLSLVPIEQVRPIVLKIGAYLIGLSVHFT